MSKKILVVEDDPDMIDLARLFLQKAGYRVLGALGGQAGLDVLSREPVDLVLLDLMMGGLNGWDVLKAIRASERWQDLPVILISARYSMVESAERAASCGMFSAYVSKPFVVRDLLQKIEFALAA
ncbi:MAG: response regulator [Chloroflexota bacterium]